MLQIRKNLAFVLRLSDVGIKCPQEALTDNRSGTHDSSSSAVSDHVNIATELVSVTTGNDSTFAFCVYHCVVSNVSLFRLMSHVFVSIICTVTAIICLCVHN